MDCAAVKPRMEALVNGSLPESERALAEQHISVCEGCRLELELVRAIGSQEKAPAVGKDDWTLDRIFGAEKNSDAPASKPGPWDAKEPEAASVSPPAAPSSSDDAADSLFGPAQPASAPPPPTTEPDAAPAATESPRKWKRAGSPPAGGASWDFEPADAKSSVKPPEQSLFFAAEALTRRKDLDSKKGSNLRVILWGAGGLVGAALLAFSSYFVLHMKPPAPELSSPRSQTPAVKSPGGTTPDASPAPGPSAVQPPVNAAPTQETAPPPDNSAQAPPGAPPRVTAASAAPQQMPLETRATGPAPVTRTPAVATTVPKPLSVAPRPAAPAEHHASRPPAPVSSAETPRPSQARPAPEQTTRAPQTGSSHKPPEPSASSEDTPTPEPAVDSTTGGQTWSDGSEDPVPAPKPARPATTARGSSMWQNQAPKPEETEPAAPAPDVNAPIERLHLATVAAEEHGDLDALRRLRTTWKSFILKIVGPDRSRAKREYADCLWAIQDLTGRRADQKDTLAAYRDYLLGAPAGGADSRSVSRLRQLEDALSEER